MTERGILFTPENYAKVAAGVKTQTRRIVKPQPLIVLDGIPITKVKARPGEFPIARADIKCPFGTVGDRLYVKEGLKRDIGSVAYRRDGQFVGTGEYRWNWKRDTLSPLHMPKWAARLWLEITEVRVERLQDLTAEDCLAEGVDCDCLDGGFDDGVAFGNFIKLWESINGPGSWDLNSWVWVLSFRKVQP